MWSCSPPCAVTIASTMSCSEAKDNMVLMSGSKASKSFLLIPFAITISKNLSLSAKKTFSTLRLQVVPRIACKNTRTWMSRISTIKHAIKTLVPKILTWIRGNEVLYDLARGTIALGERCLGLDAVFWKCHILQLVGYPCTRICSS